VVQVVSGVAVHPAHCIKLVKYLTASSIWACFEWHMESEVRSDEVAKVVPVSFSIA
jgi:hypothetical protein